MTLALYQRVVLTRDIPEEGLRAGDVGVILEHYPARAEAPEGYELEVFAAAGQTIAVVPFRRKRSAKRPSTTS